MVGIYIDSTVLALRELHADLLATQYSDSSIRERLSAQAHTILAAHASGNSAVAFHLGSWCPGLIGKDASYILASSLNLEQAQDTIAKEHGYKEWADVEALQDIQLDADFETAIDLVLMGNLAQLQARLHEKPELVNQRSQYGHQATLLHYIGANGVESYRQITPLNAPDVVRYLIHAGCDVGATALMYGGNMSTLDLLRTSAHPNNAGIAPEVEKILRDAGAT